MTTRPRCSIAGSLPIALVLLGLTPVITASADVLVRTQPPDVGMSVDGRIVDASDVPVAGALVMLAATPRIDYLAQEQTDARGAFVFRDVPVGKYRFIVIDPTGRTTVTNATGDGTNVKIDVVFGTNIEGLELKLAANVSRPPSTFGFTRAAPASTSTAFACDLPASRVEADVKLTIARTEHKDLSEGDPFPCTNPDNFGCVSFDFRSDDPQCTAPAFNFALPASTLTTSLYLREPGWTGWKPGKPPCDPIPLGWNYAGGTVHECEHRTGLEKKTIELLREYAEAIARANASTACGRDCRCKGRAVRLATAQLIEGLDAFAGGQSETDAKAAEKAYYMTVCTP